MHEDIIFKRRNRLKKHFVNVSNVLLYEYRTLSDAAKITYQVIEGFDWEDKATGESKGFVFPSIETIAEIRNAAKRTIFRHIQELEKVGLLTRVRRRNRPSILYIEEVSDAEANAYLACYVDKAKSAEMNEETLGETRTAKNSTSQQAAELPKMAVAHKNEEHEEKEHESIVNEHFTRDPTKRGEGVMQLGSLLAGYAINKQVQRTTKQKKGKPEQTIQRDYLAQEVATALGDQKSLGAFRKIAALIPERVIRDCLASVKDTWREGKIKKSRGALFTDIIQHYSQTHHIDLGFRSGAIPESGTEYRADTHAAGQGTEIPVPEKNRRATSVGKQRTTGEKKEQPAEG